MELRHFPRRQIHLVTCSLCLRVRRATSWVDAEAVIRELRTYESGSLPHLESAVCDDCLAEILDRRTLADEDIAA